MEKIVEISENVKVTKEGNELIVAKDGESNKRNFAHPRVDIKVDDKITVKTKSERKKDKAVVGTWAAHIKNMIKGVAEHYEYQLKIIYTHFPITVKVSDNDVQISNFLGEKGFRKAKILGDTKVDVQKETITVSGINKEDVGQTAANIEQVSRVSRKDRRRFFDGIFIIKKGE